MPHCKIAAKSDLVGGIESDPWPRYCEIRAGQSEPGMPFRADEIKYCLAPNSTPKGERAIKTAEANKGC
jgi:hypothetical protein